MSQNKPIGAKEYRRIIAKMADDEAAVEVVEVGVYAGGLSKCLVEVPTVEKLHLVDPWDVRKSPYHSQGRTFTQDDMGAVFAEVRELAQRSRKVVIHRMLSEEAAPLFEDESIDFWHTDGNHETEMVERDIILWLSKVKSGCLLTGDNYEMESVADAVDRLLPEREICGKGRIWFWRKP